MDAAGCSLFRGMAEAECAETKHFSMLIKRVEQPPQEGFVAVRYYET
jgi:hypothetical protein